MAKHNDFGKIGEEKATNFLLENNYMILARNWHYQKAEIDIIARKKNTIHIVEVKTRHSNPLLAPEEAVDIKKRHRLIEAANHYVENIDDEVEVQFDIISIIADKNHFELDYIPDAFESID